MPGTETPFRVSLKNSSKGYSVNTALKVKPVSGCEGLSFSPSNGIGNISLGPGETKNLDLKVQGGDTLTDGNAVFMLIASDSDFQISATNISSWATVHMPRPLLQAFLVMDTALDTNSASSGSLTSGKPPQGCRPRYPCVERYRCDPDFPL